MHALFCTYTYQLSLPQSAKKYHRLFNKNAVCIEPFTIRQVIVASCHLEKYISKTLWDGSIWKGTHLGIVAAWDLTHNALKSRTWNGESFHFTVQRLNHIYSVFTVICTVNWNKTVMKQEKIAFISTNPNYDLAYKKNNNKNWFIFKKYRANVVSFFSSVWNTEFCIISAISWHTNQNTTIFKHSNIHLFRA